MSLGTALVTAFVLSREMLFVAVAMTVVGLLTAGILCGENLRNVERHVTAAPDTDDRAPGRRPSELAATSEVDTSAR